MHHLASMESRLRLNDLIKAKLHVSQVQRIAQCYTTAWAKHLLGMRQNVASQPRLRNLAHHKICSCNSHLTSAPVPFPEQEKQEQAEPRLQAKHRSLVTCILRHAPRRGRAGRQARVTKRYRSYRPFPDPTQTQERCWPKRLKVR